MRLRVVLVLAAAGLWFGPAALAQTTESGLPDLPGMGVADDATRGQVAPSHVSRHGDTDAEPDESAPSDDRAKDASDAPDSPAVAGLPGAGVISVIPEQDVDGDVGLTSSRRETDRMPRGLTALAALGTIISVGSFLVFRDRVLGR